MSLVEQTTILCILNEKHTQFLFSFFFLGLGNIKHVFYKQMYCKVDKYVLFTQQDRKRSLFAFFSLRNLVSTRIQIGNQKEVIDHSRPGLLFPLIHAVWVEDSIIFPKLTGISVPVQNQHWPHNFGNLQTKTPFAKNPKTYNIIHWFADSLGQITCQTSV